MTSWKVWSVIVGVVAVSIIGSVTVASVESAGTVGESVRQETAEQAAARCVVAAKFDTLMSDLKQGEYTTTEEFLKENEDVLKDDPDYYVLLINYVLVKGYKSVNYVYEGDKPMEAIGQPVAAYDLPITDDEGNTVSFLTILDYGYDEELLLDAIARTQKALPRFKSRLDIHFGIVSIASLIRRWDIVGAQLEEILKISREIDNQWSWGPVNSMEGDPEIFMLKNVQAKTAATLRSENETAVETKTADVAVEKVSRAMIKYYPDSIYGYANLGALYLVTKEYEQAEKYMRRALEIDPHDKIVLGNLEKLNADKQKLQGADVRLE